MCWHARHADTALPAPSGEGLLRLGCSRKIAAFPVKDLASSDGAPSRVFDFFLSEGDRRRSAGAGAGGLCDVSDFRLRTDMVLELDIQDSSEAVGRLVVFVSQTGVTETRRGVFIPLKLRRKFPRVKSE